jgi:DNA (cytosine-5)-methyltransferase 1
MVKPNVIELFAGAGGLGIGATMAGCDVRLMVELDTAACVTLNLNSEAHSAKVLQADVCRLTGTELRQLADLDSSQPLIVTGGPPCQPFSKAAYWTDPGEESAYRRARARGETVEKPTQKVEARADDRRDLVQEFLRLVIESRADGFVFENVPSILHPRNKVIFESMRASAERAGYRTTVLKANAVNYGVPQLRHRVFCLGSRIARPAPPIPTHADDETGSLLLPPPVTAGQVLLGFDGPEHFEPEEVVIGKWAEHLRSVPPGWNYKAHTSWGGHAEPTFVTETRFWNFLLKLHPDKPSWTLAASPGPWTGPFHWTSRRLRTPELAALQTFPNKYRFAGSRRERVRQIGNAVPPLLVSHMIREVLNTFLNISAKEGEQMVRA